MVQTRTGPQEKAGEYCRFCLEKGVKKAQAFFTGNVSSHRTHITRFHYAAYYDLCKTKGIEPKAHPPEDWESRRGQKNLDGFVVAVKKAPITPPVTKTTLKEFLLEFIVDADLSFRLVERPSFLRLIHYLSPKLNEREIPKRTCINNAVLAKIERLDEIDRDLVMHIPSRVSIIYDGWSSKRRRPFSSISIQYIYSPPEDPYDWSLKSHLLAFNRTVGRHTGIMVGKDLVDTIQKFGVEKKLGWLIGDNVPVNDVAVRYVCKTLDPMEKWLVAKEVRGRCIEHTIHLMACHFVTALNVPGLGRTKQKIHDRSSNQDEFDESFDVDTNMDVEASPDDADAMRAAQEVDFDAGDVVGKLMAFIAQLRSCGEDTREYLSHLAIAQGCPQWEIKLWIRTRWGSLSDCFRTALALQKAIDRFCRLADNEDELPNLSNGRQWADYKLSASEWEIIRLAQDCLEILRHAHGELSANMTPTCYKVFPLLEMLQTRWEELLEDPRYAPVHAALMAGLKNAQKWYRKADDTSIYFISHVLNPVYKLSYVSAAWESTYLDAKMEILRKIYFKYYSAYHTSRASETSGPATDKTKAFHYKSATDQWMDKIIKKAHTPNQDMENGDPYAELNRFFAAKTLSHDECPDVIAWFGLKSTEKDYPIIRLMARDYMAVPASTCLAERTFSMSARTDDVRRRQIGSEKFGALQRLRSAYHDGRLQAVQEAWMEIGPCFDDVL